MKEFFAKLGKDLFERVIVSHWSTILFWVIGGGVYGADQIALFIAGWHSPYAGAAALVIGLIGTALKNKAKVAAVRAAAEAAKLAVALIVVAGLLFAAPARAEDPVPTRTFGGCNVAGTFCYGPSATLTLAGMDLATGQFIAGIVPGAGYGVTFFANKPYQLGVGGYAAIQIAPETTTGLFSAVVSFAEYVRVGVGRQIVGGDQHRTLVLLGLGADLK